MPLITPFPEPAAFEEVAAILDEAALKARGGPPTSPAQPGGT